MRRAAALTVLLLAGCAAPSRQLKLDLNRRIVVHDFAGAVAAVDARRDSEFGSRNAVLYWLEKGALLHQAGRYQESDSALDLAERLMEDRYTQSISKGALTFIVNDAADNYAGQVYERTLLYVLRALNYAYMGDREDAVVEARKVSAFLTEVNDRLGGRRNVYRDDAFAQYLAGLLFEDQGKADDARISYQAAHTAYAGYAELFATPEPVFDATPPLQEEGELVLLHYNGPAPRRESFTIQVGWAQALPIIQASDEARGNQQLRNAMAAGVATDIFTVALPRFVQDAYAVQGSEVVVGDRRAPTQLVEDVSAIARTTLESQMPAIAAKALSRAVIKYAGTRAIERETQKAAGDDLAALVGLFGRIGAAATEVADTRGWATIPAQFRMARLRLPAGVHTIMVRYLDRRGVVVGQDQLEGVEITAGRRTYCHVRTAS